MPQRSTPAAPQQMIQQWPQTAPTKVHPQQYNGYAGDELPPDTGLLPPAMQVGSMQQQQQHAYAMATGYQGQIGHLQWIYVQTAQCSWRSRCCRDNEAV
jgi:hypothetical protein